MLHKLFLPLALISILACGNLFAEESIDDDLSGFDTEKVETTQISDDLDGFGEEEAIIPHAKIEVEPTKEEMYILTGNVAFKTSFSYLKHEVDSIEYSGVNQAQTSLYLQIDGKLSDDWKLRVSGNIFYDAIYDIYSNNNYRDDILDAYKTQIRLDDTYIQGRLTNNLDVKIGRQIVVWGKSDSIRITDVINPLDNRLPGLTDIEDLRLSVGMLKLDYYLGMWNFSAMLIGESRIMLEAPARSEFFAVDNIFSGTLPDPFLDLVTPESSWENMQYAFAVNGVFSGWDLSFYIADILDQKWHFDKVPSPTVPLSSLKRVISKVQMLGSAINIAKGSWLLKSEVAYLDGIKYNTTRDEKNRFDALIGFDYMGIRDTVLSLEIANRHIFDYESQMANQADFVDEDEMQTAMRVTRSFSNDTLNATALVSMFGSSWQNGGFARVWLEYEVMDSVSANIGVVDYIGGDKPLMEANQDNDRIFADITYSF